MKEFRWSMQADRLSVTVGISHRIALLKQQRKKPTLIRLGGWATGYFLKEYGLKRVPEEPYYHAGILVRFRDPKIVGIAIEGEDLPPPRKKKK